MKKTPSNLTELELKVYEVAFRSSASCGHDFGITEEVVAELRTSMKAQAVGAVLASLAKKGIMTIEAPIYVNDGPGYRGEKVTQFVIADEYRFDAEDGDLERNAEAQAFFAEVEAQRPTLAQPTADAPKTDPIEHAIASYQQLPAELTGPGLTPADPNKVVSIESMKGHDRVRVGFEDGKYAWMSFDAIGHALRGHAEKDGEYTDVEQALMRRVEKLTAQLGDMARALRNEEVRCVKMNEDRLNLAAKLGEAQAIVTSGREVVRALEAEQTKRAAAATKLFEGHMKIMSVAVPALIALEQLRAMMKQMHPAWTPDSQLASVMASADTAIKEFREELKPGGVK